MAKTSGTAKELERIQKRAENILSANSARDTQFEAFEKIYWLENEEKVNASADLDPNDVKLTLSPTPANKVVGAVRLLTTTDPVPKCESEEKDKATKVENGFNRMWAASCAAKRAAVHVDAARSAVLYGPVVLVIKSLEDMLNAKGITDIRKTRLEAIQKETPFLFEALNPKTSYPVFGEFGLSGHLHKYDTTVSAVRERWGDVKVLIGKDDFNKVVVNDWYDEKFRCVWLEGGQNDQVFFDEHGLPEIPIVVTLADGSELFTDPDKRQRAFLYTVWKSGLWNRQTLTLTALFTSLFARGFGPLIGVEGADEPVKITYAGLVRTIASKGKISMLDDKAIDTGLAQAMSILNDLVTQSTIYDQTLGEPLGGGNAPFSAVALLSQAGRLPLTAPQEAVQNALAGAYQIALRWIKAENPKSFLKPGDIPEEYKFSIELNVKLPQDQMRAAQMASTLKGMVSNEWIMQNFLQITDATAEQKRVWTEQYQAMRFMAMAQQFIAAQQQAAQAAQQPPQQPGQPTPTMQPPQGLPPQGPNQMQPSGMTPGAGAEATPMTEPVPAPGEQMPGQRTRTP